MAEVARPVHRPGKGWHWCARCNDFVHAWCATCSLSDTCCACDTEDQALADAAGAALAGLVPTKLPN